MHTTRSTRLLLALASHLTLTLSAPVAHNLPIIGTIPPELACATSAASTTWTAAEVIANLPQTNSINVAEQNYKNNYLSSGADYLGPLPNSIGPDQAQRPVFTKECMAMEGDGRFYIPLKRLAGGKPNGPAGADVVIYGVDVLASTIVYCGVLTNSDEKTMNGFHQCNAA